MASNLSFPPMYVFEFLLRDERIALEQELEEIGALRHNIHEAELGIGNIPNGKTKRVEFELRKRGLYPFKTDSPVQPQERTNVQKEEVVGEKRKARGGKEKSKDTVQGREVINLDSSTEDDSATEDGEEIKEPARKKLKSADDTVLTASTVPDSVRNFKVLKVDWYRDSVKAGMLLPMEGYLVYEGKVRSAAKEPSSSPILARAAADAKNAPAPGYIRHGAANKFHRSPKSITRPTHLLHQTTSEHDDPSKLPPIPDYLQSTYSCERPTPLYSPNDEFIDLLKRIKLKRQLENEPVAVRAYSSAIASVAAYPYAITSPTEIMRLPGCDQKIANLFYQYQNNGTVDEVTDMETDPQMKVLEHFYNIWGVGDATARDFYGRGWRDLDDVVEYGWDRLKKQQQVGVKYYDEFLDPIPRDEVEDIGAIILEEANKLMPGYQMVIVGGYRRGKTFSGDVDVILTHPDAGSTLHFIDKITDKLEDIGWITHILQRSNANSERGQTPVSNKSTEPGSGFDTLDKALVVWQNIKFDQEAHEKNPNSHRRVDVIISPWKTAGCAIIGWSGGTTFERDLRRYVRHEKNWKFDSSGMRDRTNGNWLDLEGEVVGAEAGKLREKEMIVFEKCGLEWKEPDQRCTG